MNQIDLNLKLLGLQAEGPGNFNYLAKNTKMPISLLSADQALLSLFGHDQCTKKTELPSLEEFIKEKIDKQLVETEGNFKITKSGFLEQVSNQTFCYAEDDQHTIDLELVKKLKAKWKQVKFLRKPRTIYYDDLIQNAPRKQKV